MNKFIWIALGIILITGFIWHGYFNKLQILEIPAQPETVEPVFAAPETSARPAPSMTDIDPAANSSASESSAPVQRQMQGMATQQQAILSYPDYSQPYTYLGQAFESWNQAYVVEVPVLDGTETVALQLNQYHYIYPQPIEGSVNASAALQDVQIELVEVGSGAILHSQRSDGDFLIATQADWGRELRIRAQVRVREQQEQLSTDLNFHYPAATVEAVGEGRVEQDHVLTEVTLHTEEAGIYRVRAALEDEAGNRLAVLTARQRLGEGRQAMQIRAHHSVIPQSATELYLVSLLVERMSSHPGELQRYGQSNQERWPLGSVNLFLLNTTPYTPTESEQRQLEFLQNWQG